MPDWVQQKIRIQIMIHGVMVLLKKNEQILNMENRIKKGCIIVSIIVGILILVYCLILTQEMPSEVIFDDYDIIHKENPAFSVTELEFDPIILEKRKFKQLLGGDVHCRQVNHISPLLSRNYTCFHVEEKLH